MVIQWPLISSHVVSCPLIDISCIKTAHMSGHMVAYNVGYFMFGPVMLCPLACNHERAWQDMKHIGQPHIKWRAWHDVHYHWFLCHIFSCYVWYLLRLWCPKVIHLPNKKQVPCPRTHTYQTKIQFLFQSYQTSIKCLVQGCKLSMHSPIAKLRITGIFPVYQPIDESTFSVSENTPIKLLDYWRHSVTLSTLQCLYESGALSKTTRHQFRVKCFPQGLTHSNQISKNYKCLTQDIKSPKKNHVPCPRSEK